MRQCKVCNQRKEYIDFPSSGGNKRKNTCKICYAGLQKIKMRYRKLYAKKGA